MEMIKFYQGLRRLNDKGEIVNAYGRSQNSADPDNDILGEFIEYI